MAVRVTDADTELPSPIERAEAVLVDRDLPFDRLLEEELVAELPGGWCNFRLWMNWEPMLGALFLTSSYDLKIPEAHRTAVYPLLARINEHVLLGHFDMSSEDGSICYRYGQRMDSQHVSEELIGELIDVAVIECERFYPAFQTVLWGKQTTEDALKLVLFEPIGNA